MRIEDILQRLDGVKQTGQGQWMAICPCHNDGKASLSITLSGSGNTLVHCHAGCRTENIVESMGLKMHDLFAEGSSGARNSKPQTGMREIQKPKPQTKPSEAKKQQPFSPIVATYPYHDASGSLLYEKLRREGKFFSQHRPDGKGGWASNLQGVAHVLYRLHEVAKADTVFVCEGEKDADTLASTGHTATTGANGAGQGKWLKEYSQQLAEKVCFVLGDNDDIGRAFQIETANALHGIAKSVKVLDLASVWADIPDHGDVSDFFEAKGEEDALSHLAYLMRDTPEWTPIPVPLVEKKPVDKRTSRETPPTVRPSDLSDAGNAAVFTEAHKGGLLYTKSLGWLFWDGAKWERDEFEPTRLALKLTQAMLDDALSHCKRALSVQADAMAADDETALTEAKKAVQIEKAYLRHAKISRYAVRLHAMIELSKAALVTKADVFDANPFELNTPSGIVDLTTGSIRPHDRKAYCSQITASAPSNEGATMWADFLNTVTSNSEDIKKFLQVVAGMALVGKVFHEGIVLAHGGGRNGKSTLFNALGSALGTYSGSIAVTTLTTDRQNKGASLATLRGKRLVVTGELEEHQRLSVSTLKQLGSTDMLTIEEKFKAPEDVKQTHTLVLFTNHLPRVGSTDAGTWRRLTVVPFNATIAQGVGIQNFADVLFEQAGGAVVSWAVQGAVKFVASGYKLVAPDEIKAATDAYKSREDWLGNFIDECCIRDVHARVGANELYKVYHSWAEETGDYVRRSNEFVAGMEQAGFQNIKPKNKSTWIGLKTVYTDVYGGATAASY